MRFIVAPAAMVALIAGCQTVHEGPGRTLGHATLHLANNGPAGSARLLQNADEVSLSITLTELEEGVHGLHLHAIASCELPDFTSAGAHLNPTDRQHVFENPQGAHLRDLPNAMIGASGSGTVSALLHGTPEEVISRIFDADGTAIVVHAHADDYWTDPSGNSGERIACGVLVRG